MSNCNTMNLLAKLRAVFSERLKHYRESRDWTQHDLAAAAEMKTPTLRGYEQQSRWPDPEEIEALAEALEIPVFKLFGTDFQTSPDEALEVISRTIKAKPSPVLSLIPDDIAKTPAFSELLRLVAQYPDILGDVLSIATTRAIGRVDKAKRRTPTDGR